MNKNNQWLKATVLGAVLLFLTAHSTPAQWNASFTYEQEFNTNPFRSVEATPSWISVYDLAVRHNFTNSTAGYFGNYGSFSQLDSRDFYRHQLAWWGGSNQTSWGAIIEQRLNSPDYKIYNYNTSTAYVTHNTALHGIRLQFSGAGQIILYPELDDFDNVKFNTGFLVNKSFPTRTTVIASGGVHYKKYLTKIISYEDSTNSTKKTPLRMKVNDSVYYESSPGITQFNWRIRLAQSLTQTTGLAVQYSQRQLLELAAKSIDEIPYSSYQESEVFDDPMSYNGYTVGTEVTQLLPLGILLKAAYYSNWKDYPGQPAYVSPDIYNENLAREDRSQTAWIYFEKKIFIQLFHEDSIKLTGTFQWRENQSNSYWYNYSMNYGAIGLQYDF